MSPRTKKAQLPAGWMGLHGRRWLARQAAKHPRIIEIGSWLGRSTKVLARYGQKVWAVDHWQGAQHDPSQAGLYADALATRNIYAEFRRNLHREIARGRVIPMKMTSSQAHVVLLEQYGLASFDMVFIDADHSYRGCLADLEHYTQLIRPGGLICGHDYNAERWPGVVKAVDFWFSACVPRDVAMGPSTIWSVTA